MVVPIARASIYYNEKNVYEFSSWANNSVLLSLDVQVSEIEKGRNGLSGSFTIFDRRIENGRRWWEFFLWNGGIPAPKELFEQKEEEEAEETTDGIDLNNIPEGLTGDELARVILAYCNANGITSDFYQAAILGTCEKESAMGVHTAEIGGPSTSYAPWYGRGLIQVTWESNYKSVGEKLGHDFVANPEDLRKLKFAIPALCRGMNEGWYTSKKLSDYAPYDYSGTRNIVNPGEGGSRRAEYVEMCGKWHNRIPELRKGKAPGVASTGAPNTGAVGSLLSGFATSIGATEVVVDPIKGYEMILERGNYQDETLQAFHMLIVGISIDVRAQTVTFSGRGVSALMSREKKFTTKPNYTLAQLANDIAAKYGIRVQMPNVDSASTISTIKQQGTTDLQLLQSVASKYSLKMEEDKKTLKFSEAGVAKQFLIKLNRINALPPTFSENASLERITGSKRIKEALADTKLYDLKQVPDGEKIGEGFSVSVPCPFTTSEMLAMQPGSKMAIAADLVYETNYAVFAREYRIKSLSHSWKHGVATSVIEGYLPVPIQSQESAKNEAGEQSKGTPVVQLLPGEKDYILFQAIGGKNASGFIDMEFVRILNGAPQAPRFPGLTGSGRVQDLSKVATKGSYGPCPPGVYELGPVEDKGADNSWGEGLGRIFIPLKNTPGREGIGIHWDSNAASGSIGTAGCIAAKTEADVLAIAGWVNSGSKKIQVDYTRYKG